MKAAHTPGAAVTVADLEAWEKQPAFVFPRATLCSPTIPVRPQGPAGSWQLNLSSSWMKARGVALTSGFHSVAEASYGGQVDGLRSADHRFVDQLPLLDSP